MSSDSRYWNPDSEYWNPDLNTGILDPDPNTEIWPGSLKDSAGADANAF